MKAIIADDEPLLALSLRSALAEAWPELEVAAVLPNGLEAVQAAERLKPEVAFLDIQMPGMTGLEAAEEVLERMGDSAPAIVFVTHNVEEAVYMASRVVVMTPGPGRTAGEIAVPGPAPRPHGFRASAGFRATAERVSDLLAEACAR